MATAEISIRLVVTLAIILAGLAGRSAVDKILTLRGGPELVALWAQLSSVIELVAGVALAGIGTGLSVLVAQDPRLEHQRALLRESFRVGLGLSAAAMVAVALLAWLFPERSAMYGLSPGLVTLAALVGCASVLPGMINGYWLGQQHRERMLALAVASALLPVAAGLAAPLAWVLAAVAFAHALPALVAPFVARGPSEALARAHHDVTLLRHYVWAGVSIGILSPASMLAARAIVSGSLSWHDVGMLQALWRVSEWIAALAAGTLSVHFLPRLSAAYGSPRFERELRRCALMTVLPSAAAFVALLAFHRPVFALLYDESLVPTPLTAALFFAGSIARIASWVPLFALYAMRRTRALVVGELLSLPLFAALLAALSEGLTLERAAALWLVSYVVYGAFNLWAVQRTGPLPPLP